MAQTTYEFFARTLLRLKELWRIYCFCVRAYISDQIWFNSLNLNHENLRELEYWTFVEGVRTRRNFKTPSYSFIMPNACSMNAQIFETKKHGKKITYLQGGVRFWSELGQLQETKLGQLSFLGILALMANLFHHAFLDMDESRSRDWSPQNDPLLWHESAKIIKDSGKKSMNLFAFFFPFLMKMRLAGNTSHDKRPSSYWTAWWKLTLELQ